jgi:hypothetical protein
MQNISPHFYYDSEYCTPFAKERNNKEKKGLEGVARARSGEITLTLKPVGMVYKKKKN